MNTRTYRLGLTGSIGMGKSTTAQMFAAEGVPVWDADAVVAQLYGPGGGAVAALAATWPDTVVSGAVDRAALKRRIATDPDALRVLESIVHPLVAASRARFLTGADGPLVVLDIPLLFETGVRRDLDGVLVVTAPAAIQRARVLARPGMTAEQFDLIASRQMPDAEKRALADFVIETTDTDSARRAVRALVGQLVDGARHD